MNMNMANQTLGLALGLVLTHLLLVNTVRQFQFPGQSVSTRISA